MLGSASLSDSLHGFSRFARRVCAHTFRCQPSDGRALQKKGFALSPSSSTLPSAPVTPSLGATHYESVDDASAPAPLLRDTAYNRIRDAIRYGTLEPGEPLSETRLSQWLGISRTPVREALQQLARQGLVQIIPGRAVTVAAPSMEETLNAIHVRSILEPVVVQMATESISNARLEELWTALRTMEAAVEQDDREGWSRADSTYHEIISSACPNQLLGELSQQIRGRVSFVAIDIRTSPERLAACTLEHRHIVEAMARRQPEAAAEAMRVHIDQLLQSTVQKFNHR